MFSATAEYALRALIYLATLPNGEAALGRSIAQNSGVPKNYLSKILHTLKNAGYVETARGTGGGYRLRRPAAGIRLVDVADLFESPRARLGCFLGNERECTDERPCSAHARWSQIRTRYIEFMDGTTVSELTRDPPNASQTVASAPSILRRRPAKPPGRRPAITPLRRGGRS